MELDRKPILDQLDRISSSEEFRRKPVMRKLLAYLVTECIEGRSDQIKGYCIGVDVFGQQSSTDPGKGALVRNNAVRLRGLLKTYYLGDGEADPIVIDVPKGRYVPRFTRNDSLRNKKNLAGSPREADDCGRPSIAVLPFRNLSDDPSLDFLTIGFSKALSDELTKFEDLRVIGLGQLTDRDGSADKTRLEAVAFLIEGEIQTAGTLIKISFRLINATDGANLWGDSFTFDIEKDNVFEVQGRITDRIASIVGGEYGQINQFRYQIILNSRPQSLTEQFILLKHYHNVTLLTEESMAEFHQDLHEALEKDQDSAVLNAIAGGFYGSIWATTGPGADEALQELARLTEKAYALNPNHQLILQKLGFKCFVFDERDRFFRLFEDSKEWLANSP
ncbi:MAG: hypothetical protein ACR2QU_03315, partial [Gammaproteobacteria bacterium]